MPGGADRREPRSSHAPWFCFGKGSRGEGGRSFRRRYETPVGLAGGIVTHFSLCSASTLALCSEGAAQPSFLPFLILWLGGVFWPAFIPKLLDPRVGPYFLISARTLSMDSSSSQAARRGASVTLRSGVACSERQIWVGLVAYPPAHAAGATSGASPTSRSAP